MRHPFDLDPAELKDLELDFEENLTDEESGQVGGGLSIATTLAIGEEGGDCYPIVKDPRYLGPPCIYPLPYPKPLPIKPPEATTLALGEEGGDCYPIY